MKRLQENYLWIVFALSLLGAVLAYYSSEAGYVTQVLKTLDSSGHQIDNISIKPSPLSWILSFAATFAFTLAISVFISVFVSKRIDRAFAGERDEELKALQDAINVNVFDSLFKTLVPVEIFEVFKSDVISNKIIRKNANWLYDFRLHGDQGEIELTQTIKYELHNISRTSVNDAISAKMSAHAVGSGIVRAVVFFEGSEVASFSAKQISRGPPDKTETMNSSDGKVRITRHEDGVIDLLISVEIPPGSKVDVTVIYVTIYGDNYVNDAYFTKYPMVNASLIATYPEGFELEIFQALSSELRRTLHEKNMSMYEARGGILPHQGFVYTLRKIALQSD